MTMNLYIIKEVLSDYTSGMAVIAAPSLDRVRELYRAEFGDYCMEEYDFAISNGEYKVIEGVNHPEGIVSYVYGGG